MIHGAPFRQNARHPARLPPIFKPQAQDDAVALKPIQRFHEALTAAASNPKSTSSPPGGHGFGMKKRGATSDHWADSFYYWLDAQGLLK